MRETNLPEYYIHTTILRKELNEYVINDSKLWQIDVQALRDNKHSDGYER